MFSDDNKRFKVIYKQGAMTAIRIIQDTKTGVNYLFTVEGYGGGLTVLLDSEGKPVVTPVDSYNE